MFHVTACNAFLMGTLASGSMMVFMRRWDTVKAFELIERERVTATGGVPAIAWQILEHPDRDRKYDLSSLEIDRLWRCAVGARAGPPDRDRSPRAARRTAGE